MQKQYDDFVKLKVKEMSRTISKLTYTYLDPDTKKATVVPASHYEKWLNQNKEETIDQAIQYQFLNVIYTQIKNLKTENPRYFQEALLCLDLNLKPTDMAVDEQLALTATSVMMNMEEETKKKNFIYWIVPLSNTSQKRKKVRKFNQNCFNWQQRIKIKNYC